MNDLYALSALDQARLIRSRAASAREVVQSFLTRLEAVNGGSMRSWRCARMRRTGSLTLPTQR